MAATKQAFLDRLARKLAELEPRLEGEAPRLADLRAEHQVVTERLKAARRAGAALDDDELRAARLAVERHLEHVGRLAA